MSKKLSYTITLETIESSDFNSLLELTSNPEVMKFIGNSKTWNSEKVKTFIKYCQEENKTPDNRRQNYYYKIVDNSNTNPTPNTMLGVIGFHIFKRKEMPDIGNEFFLTVYMNPKYQGKGIYSQAYNLLIEKIKKHQPRKNKLYILVRKNNEKMNNLARSKYQFLRIVRFESEELNLYVSYIKKEMNKKETQRHQKTKTKTKTKKRNEKNCYIVESERIPMNSVARIMNSRGNWEKCDLRKTKKIDFNYIEGMNLYQKKKNFHKAYLKNVINGDKHNISRKDELYKNLNAYMDEHPKASLKKYMLEQYNFDWSDIYHKHKIQETYDTVKKIFDNDPGKIWIYKPVSGFRGMLIEIFKKYDEFESFMNDFIKKQESVWKSTKELSKLVLQSNWVLQEYVEKPLLFDNKKIHIRPIFLYHKRDNQKTGYIFDKILVAHAYEDYKFDDFSNKRIHDTHFASTTSGRIYFHEDFIKLKILTPSQVSDIENQIKDLGSYLLDLLNAGCYDENDECFEIFGTDLLIDTRTLEIKIMEAQVTNISFGFFDDDRLPGYTNIFEYIFANAIETIVDQYFKPSRKVKTLGDFNKFYQKTIS